MQISRQTRALAKRLQASSSKPLTDRQAIVQAILFNEQCQALAEQIQALQRDRQAQGSLTDKTLTMTRG